MTRVLVAVIRLYRKYLSPQTAPNCRYQPTCSAYAIEALQRHGAIRGSALAIRRLTRCHPWRPGGYDPVPPAKPEHRDRRFLLTATSNHGPIKEESYGAR